MNKPTVLSLTLVLAASAIPATAQAPKAEKGYTISVFAKGVKGKYTAPDSIAVIHNHIFIGYGDNNDPTGADGKSNQIIEYTKEGQLVRIYTVKGHNDGLKMNPYTGRLWAMQNEDANPNLVIIDPETHEQQLYQFAEPPAAGGGYDDITFRNGHAYFSASNPAHNPNRYPAIVEAKIVGNTVEVTPTLLGNSKAIDVVTGDQVILNLQDPDSMTLTPGKDILLDSQGDSELIMVHKPGPHQSTYQIPLSSPFGTPQADDTLFVPSGDGFILVSDTPANIVYKISKDEFVPGTPYTAAVGAPDATGATVGFVGILDLNFGELVPIVTGLQSPHGEGFVKTRDDDDDDNPCSQGDQN
jgi:hypothetical protein